MRKTVLQIQTEEAEAPPPEFKPSPKGEKVSLKIVEDKVFPSELAILLKSYECLIHIFVFLCVFNCTLNTLRRPKSLEVSLPHGSSEAKRLPGNAESGAGFRPPGGLS